MLLYLYELWRRQAVTCIVADKQRKNVHRIDLSMWELLCKFGNYIWQQVEDMEHF